MRNRKRTGWHRYINGMNISNGLSTSEGLSPGNGYMTNEHGRMVVQYMVRCALAASSSGVIWRSR